MPSAILSPILAFTDYPAVDILLRVLAFLCRVTWQSKQDRELTECNQRLNDCQEKLRQSEEQRKKFEDQRDLVILVCLVGIAIAVLASIEYRMVPRSLPA